LLVDDLTTIKDLGCNFIRAVHYPQAPEFLDLCDQLGLLVWEESLGWQIGEAELLSPTTTAHLAMQTRQMIRDGINHPSIIIWAFLNECPSDSMKVEHAYAELASLVRSEDPSRLVSYASNQGEKDRCFSHVDVVSLNLYPGWFEPRSWTAPTVSMIAPHVDRIAGLATRPDVAGKPMLVSEIGACALYGCRDRAKAQWSEEFQADYMEEACRAVLADARWAGVVLWQFCDTRSYVGVGDVRGKPRGFNNAGLLDEYRRPKLAAARVEAAFREEHPQ
jgi:beta-glucuronidase